MSAGWIHYVLLIVFLICFVFLLVPSSNEIYCGRNSNDHSHPNTKQYRQTTAKPKTTPRKLNYPFAVDESLFSSLDECESVYDKVCSSSSSDPFSEIERASHAESTEITRHMVEEAGAYVRTPVTEFYSSCSGSHPSIMVPISSTTLCKKLIDDIDSSGLSVVDLLALLYTNGVAMPFEIINNKGDFFILQPVCKKQEPYIASITPRILGILGVRKEDHEAFFQFQEQLTAGWCEEEDDAEQDASGELVNLCSACMQGEKHTPPRPRVRVKSPSFFQKLLAPKYRAGLGLYFKYSVLVSSQGLSLYAEDPMFSLSSKEASVLLMSSDQETYCDTLTTVALRPFSDAQFSQSVFSGASKNGIVHTFNQAKERLRGVALAIYEKNGMTQQTIACLLGRIESMNLEIGVEDYNEEVLSRIAHSVSREATLPDNVLAARALSVRYGLITQKIPAQTIPSVRYDASSNTLFISAGASMPPMYSVMYNEASVHSRIGFWMAREMARAIDIRAMRTMQSTCGEWDGALRDITVMEDKAACLATVAQNDIQELYGELEPAARMVSKTLRYMLAYVAMFNKDEKENKMFEYSFVQGLCSSKKTSRAKTRSDMCVAYSLSKQKCDYGRMAYIKRKINACGFFDFPF